ncbi:Kinase superfamily protein isoform 2 [Hibiscus syriacus]|uniref:Kinase superfamily protein isoform 2 n=1 Tax=Hibiscus syriacus TaxID=106335 RepID=A0A6A3C499_HIBSY|nr:Kinase superfamily protein isoform 2 [Hibiscus syriacus]
MPQQIKAPQQVPSFEYELLEGDPDQLRIVVATPSQAAPWINPLSLKLKHRIEYHEVAVKMLHPLKEEHMQNFIDKFEKLFLKCRELHGVCWLHGISVLNEKMSYVFGTLMAQFLESICIAMGFYEGSLGDQMAQSKGGNLSLPDTLRYGIQLARGLMQLQSIGLLVLNLKPSNFLISDRDQLVLGDFGIAYLLLGVPFSDSDISLRLGTPNYMAPEQWDPEVRGPLSLETDVWGFGCSIVEMLTGVQPCSQNAIHGDGGWIGSGSRPLKEKSIISGYTSWYLSKDRLQVGDTVRSRTPLNARRPQTVDVREGTVVGLDGDADKNTFVLVKVPGMHNALRVQESTLERVTSGLAAGDWVRLKQETNTHSPMGNLHLVRRDGTVTAGFIGLEKLWTDKSHQLEMAKPYYTGQYVRLKATVLSPRLEWPRKRGGAWSSGRISEILPNGCLVVEFPAIKLTITVGRGINAILKKNRPNSKDGAGRNPGWRRMILDGGSTK